MAVLAGLGTSGGGLACARERGVEREGPRGGGSGDSGRNEVMGLPPGSDLAGQDRQVDARPVDKWRGVLR